MASYTGCTCDKATPHVKKIAILGSTGSIGTSTLSICEQFPLRYTPIALAAGSNIEVAFAQAKQWRPKLISIATEPLADALKLRLRTEGITGIEVLSGIPGTIAVATHPEVEFVVSAIVGVAGLEATYAAVQAGKTIGLANKECLVAAGDLIISAARAKNVALLPIDSEHNAVHQAMRGGTPAEVKQIWLTASGGPFRNTPLEQFQHITPHQALKHPTWVMGQRITIDSATMMNKGFEVIEACRLFDLPAAKVRVTVHPQSTVHSLVEFIDGSILAQISVTDMRLPILYALAYPERPASNLTFDLAQLSQLDFSQPDLAKFPCLRLAYEAADAGPSACIALNAADEIAVAAFLAGHIPFLGIPRTIERVLELTPAANPTSIQGVLAADQAARTCAREVIARA
ncbi:1-deoxy-D-xylulose 5-phosphate reductoisomerase [Granulicella tundricola MP5ACTX9]|uniref:1-deoxy-D-xylulose 5-phosphate reductoisomerase n=1 Tax=Granulicella tundricola (strain ATCC BAA-1859 / DSM 23138 / MP5ACTX9) TaxID=1198114 RepID=E8X3G8_GRATM|nr:1-deoxy-D-xylulose 5-phosphate reductoisomerase [Granulicella tundricola MP5ACTX9]